MIKTRIALAFLLIPLSGLAQEKDAGTCQVFRGNKFRGQILATEHQGTVEYFVQTRKEMEARSARPYLKPRKVGEFNYPYVGMAILGQGGNGRTISVASRGYQRWGVLISRNPDSVPDLLNFIYYAAQSVTYELRGGDVCTQVNNDPVFQQELLVMGLSAGDISNSVSYREVL